MSAAPFILFEPIRPTPLVVDSPHSGRDYPADFKYSCPPHLLRQTEDSYVDELVLSATQAGATVITANFARSYIDVNRAEDDIDPALLVEPWPEPLSPSDRTLLGLGLVRRLCKSGVPVYAGPLGIVEVQNRIVNYYRPYHEALKNTVADRMKQFGECYLIDCHSMPGQGIENPLSPRADFVLGDRTGKSSDPYFTGIVCTLLREMGYNVALNDPYKGMEITQRYGQPKTGQHALQLEINRRLYMNEQTLEKTAGFERLKKELGIFFKTLAVDLARSDERIAAE